MTINPRTGEIEIEGTSIGPTTGEDEFLTSVVGKQATRVRKSPTRHWYEVWCSDVSGQRLGAVFSFIPHAGLRRARIKFVKPNVVTWSREVEDEIKRFHDNWLRQQLGEPPYQFPWGWIGSVVDQHGYSAVIIVDYGPEPR